MDIAILANLFLFLGALGLDVGTGGSGSGSDTTDDPLYNPNNYSKTHDGTSGDDHETADGDNQAWFLHDGNDDLSASSANDYTNMGAGNDHAEMGAGADIALGGDGQDSLAGGVGADSLFGDAGNDQLQGNQGDDGLAGGDGNDDLWGGSGADILNGGLGDDTISGFEHGAAGAAGMTGAEGADQLIGGEGNDLLILGHGDAASGGAGNDMFTLDTRWNDGTGVSHIVDYDRTQDELHLIYTPLTDIDSSQLLQPTVTLTTTADGSTEIRLNGSVVAMLDGVTGLSVDDIVLQADSSTDPSFVPGNYGHVLHGDDGSNSYSGGNTSGAWLTGGGADHLTGSTQNDYADLGAGDDHAAMGAGDDSVLGHAGADHIAGGDGGDTLRGGDGADTLHGDAGNDRMAGDAGNDLMAGGTGSDSLLGGGGDDTLSGYSETHAGESSLTARDGSDTLAGGDGNDTLILGHGDTGNGGAGADLFDMQTHFADGTEPIAITDFQRGIDRLQLHYKAHFNTSGAEVPPVVTVQQSSDGTYSAIRVDGVLVANVTTPVALTLSDVHLVREA